MTDRRTLDQLLAHLRGQVADVGRPRACPTIDYSTAAKWRAARYLRRAAEALKNTGPRPGPAGAL
jgi:hypothetical protein